MLYFGVSGPGLKPAKTKKIYISLFELFELFAVIITGGVWCKLAREGFFNRVFGLVRKESFLSFPAFVPGYRVVATGQVSPVSLTRLTACLALPLSATARWSPRKVHMRWQVHAET